MALLSLALNIFFFLIFSSPLETLFLGLKNMSMNLRKIILMPWWMSIIIIGIARPETISIVYLFFSLIDFQLKLIFGHSPNAYIITKRPDRRMVRCCVIWWAFCLTVACYLSYWRHDPTDLLIQFDPDFSPFARTARFFSLVFLSIDRWHVGGRFLLPRPRDGSSIWWNSAHHWCSIENIYSKL